MMDSGFLEFKLDYDKTKNFAIGESVRSSDISAGELVWRVICFPRGRSKEENGEHLSIFLQLVSRCNNIVVTKAIFDAFMIGRDGTPSWLDARRCVTHVHPFGCGWPRFVSRTRLESLYVARDGRVTITCGVIVLRHDPLYVPPSDMGAHIGRLLGTDAAGSDVSFVVGGETFPAHRAVLAARSPVFEAQLFGSMADATTSSITVHDVTPAVFRVMLRFIYTDALPGDEEIGDSLIEMMRHLLVAADRYALDRLKLMCARKLWDNVSVDTVAASLACAEAYNCPDLKNKCIAFLMDEKNFRDAVLTDGFVQLKEQCPSIVAELRKAKVPVREKRKAKLVIHNVFKHSNVY